ncbi:LapA family protein [Priestia megaterium]|nr:LapA family protein [Priestia megaterium]RFB32547.1 LapA family protein [Bacillus sp. RC]MDP1442514.1 LapA family protein [Priestia megaterium]MDP1471486.1 LapA family protein [Priestia megaterium]MDR0132260.1 LapA family protein [Priestia megaterium]MDR4221702.1 LapA family protein [Priestia megaterium]
MDYTFPMVISLVALTFAMQAQLENKKLRRQIKELEKRHS